MKTSIFLLLVLFSSLSYPQTIVPPATCSAVIGSPANGPSHYIDVSWTVVSGATYYEAQYSVDSLVWDSLYTGTSLITSHNTGSEGNLPFYYRVRAIQNTTESDWAYATPYPIFSACNDPGAPALYNASTNTMQISVPPDNNSAFTTYSIFCTTDSMYVQPDGTLALTEAYQTRSLWDSLTITGLSSNINYCFYTKARNGNGDIRVAHGVAVSFFESWSADVLDTTSASPTNVWWSPDTASGTMQYFSTGGCTNGNVGFEGGNNNYWSSFLRSPAVNCTGLSQVTLQFNIINSYFATHPNDKVTFTMWAPTPSYPQGTFINALTVNGATGYILPFDSARNCEAITVVYDLADVTDKSAILLFLNATCAYNDANDFNVRFTNTSIGAGGLASACEPTNAVAVTEISQIAAHDFSVYPNPFNDHFTISLNTVFENCIIQLYEESGRKVSEYELPKNSTNADIATGALPGGIYFLNIISEGKKIATRKLVKVD